MKRGKKKNPVPLKTFYIDFEGYCEIEATDEQTAEEIFWEMVRVGQPLPHGIYEVLGREEKEGA